MASSNPALLCKTCHGTLSRLLDPAVLGSTITDYENGVIDGLRHLANYEALAHSASTGCIVCAHSLASLGRGPTDKEAPVMLIPYSDNIGHFNPSFLELDPEVSSDYKIGFEYFRLQCSSHACSVFRISSLDEHPSTICGRIIADSFDSALAKKWLSDCRGYHSACRKPGGLVELPSRVLDLSDAEPRLLETEGRFGEYLALSHCWGDPNISQPLKTTNSNINAHKQGIPVAALPQTFLDAIIVARDLGFEYLWIDSLCIIQDSTEDWERECDRMGNIYANAVLTIAAEDATDGRAGFLASLHTDPRYPDLCSGHLSSNANDSSITVTLSSAAADSVKCHIAKVLHEPASRPHAGHLGGRGWTFQERMLSPRTLRFRNREMSFECVSSTCYEGIRYPIREESTNGEITKNIIPKTHPKHDVDGDGRPLTPEQAYAMSWQTIVENYTARMFTFGDDRLPALAGVARSLESEGNRYLAGLWQNCIATCLAWSADVRKPSRNLFQAKIDAPSWSWASSDRPVVIADGAVSATCESSLVLRDFGIEIRGGNRWGHVEKGTLTVEGYKRTLGGMQLEGNTMTMMVDEDVHLRGRLSLDHLSTPVAVASSNLSILLLLVDRVGSGTGPPDWYALVMRPVSLRSPADDSETFERIGLLRSKPRDYRDGGGRPGDAETMKWKRSLDWLEGGERCTIKLV